MWAKVCGKEHVKVQCICTCEMYTYMMCACRCNYTSKTSIDNSIDRAHRCDNESQEICLCSQYQVIRGEPLISRYIAPREQCVCMHGGNRHLVT